MPTLVNLGAVLGTIALRIAAVCAIWVKVSWLISALAALIERVPVIELLISTALLDVVVAVWAATTMSSSPPAPAMYCSWLNCVAVNEVWAPTDTPPIARMPPLVPRSATL